MRYRMKANAGSEAPTNIMSVAVSSAIKASWPDSRYEVHSLKHYEWMTLLDRGDKPPTIKTGRGDSPRDFWSAHEAAQNQKKPLWCVGYDMLRNLTLLRFFDMLDIESYRVYIGGEWPGWSYWQSPKPFSGLLAVDGAPTIVKVRGKRGTCWFVDLLNYWQQPLSKMTGTSLTPWYTDMTELDAIDAGPGVTLDQATVIMGTFRDLMCTWKKADRGNWQPTAAGLSMNNFRHTVVDASAQPRQSMARYDLHIDTTHPAIPLEREAYRGGWVEAFWQGTMAKPVVGQECGKTLGMNPYPGPFHLLDVRSLYPHVMRHGLYPVERVRKVTGCHPGELADLLPAYSAVAEVLIDSASATYPCTIGNRQIMATGTFWTVLCGDELAQALSRRHVIDVRNAWLYRTAPLFRDWVDYWWQARSAAEKAGDMSSADLAKLIMNSLHGKFAQKPSRWRPSPRTVALKRWGKWWAIDADKGTEVQYKAIAGIVYEPHEGDEPSHTFPAISGTIAANARQYMRGVIESAGRSNVYYIGTDCLIVSDKGLGCLTANRMVDKYQMGKLAIKHVSNNLTINGCNDWSMDEHRCLSGPFATAVGDDVAGWVAKMYLRYRSTTGQQPDGLQWYVSVPSGPNKAMPKGLVLPSGWLCPHRLELTDRAKLLRPDEIRRAMRSAADPDLFGLPSHQDGEE